MKTQNNTKEKNMKTQNNKTAWLAGVILMAGTLLSATAADFTWSGGGADNNWGTAANWVGGAVPGVNPTLFFSGAGGTTTNNLAGSGRFDGITFNADAGAFTITGNPIANLYGNLTNNSASTQTFQNAVAIGWANRTFSTLGNLVFEAGLGEIGGSFGLIKTGIGTLTVQGNSSYTRVTRIDAGKMVIDLSGGGSFASPTLRFGTTVAAEGNSSTVEFKGGAGGNTLNLTSSLDGSSPLTVNNNTANKLKLTSTGGATSASIALMQMFGASTLNFDLSSANTSVSFGTFPTLTYNILSRVTVTDSSGKTGFFANNGSGQAKAFDAYDGVVTAAGVNVFSNNYSATGDVNMNNNSAYAHSFTITGGGSLTTTSSVSTTTTGGVLMQENAGNFTIDAATFSTPVIHQYSTSGILIIDAALASGSGTFAKTGPGAVRLAAGNSSTYTGATYIQQGRFEVDGALTNSSAVTVFDGATLSGSGSVAPVTVRAGGTLQGATSDSLNIAGTLTLDSHAKFHFTLGAGADSVHATGAVTLASNATLQLVLDGAPALNTDIYLLRSDAAINGNFVYNNAVMTDGSVFTLGGYNFTYFQDSQNIWVSAVPEPTVVTLFGIGLAVLLLRRRRSESR